MKKKDWGNAIWLLFHTLAEKLKDEHISELPILVAHITQICANLPCPDCEQHATKTMARVNKAAIAASKEALIDFLWQFHNEVNKKTAKTPYYPKESLDRYKMANTYNVVKQFIIVMTSVANNEKTMLYGFHRSLYMKQFIDYINKYIYKYNP
jgi:hypothetical protein